ncbi:MAG: hypothetical protein ACI8WB_002085 [Phenylobacterium sp.]|jgi:hypothetical protein
MFLVVYAFMPCHSFADNKTKTPRVPITVETDIYHYAMDVLKGREAIDVDDFSGPMVRRDIVDFILVQKAIALGGFDIHFTFNHGNYDARNPKLLAKGLLLVSFDSIWLSRAEQMKEDVYISQPIVRKGEYWAGVYTSPDNSSALAIKTLDDLRRHSVISSRAWKTDWATLLAINPRQLVNESDWLSMTKMVSRSWVDVMLIPFTKETPFQYQGNGYKVVAIPGVKVMLDDSRHYLVSRKHPLGAQTFAALQRGLAILRKQGAIVKAYQQCGFLNEEVSDWVILNGLKGK